MQQKGVKRLVQLSSMGIGDDKVQYGFIKGLWWTLLRTLLRSAHHDLITAEKIVTDADPSLDYLLVRPMGLTPSEPPRGSWGVLHKERGYLPASVAKSDVALFMLEQATNPTLIQTAVTVGGGKT